jgi:hypothetical protein
MDVCRFENLRAPVHHFLKRYLHSDESVVLCFRKTLRFYFILPTMGCPIFLLSFSRNIFFSHRDLEFVLDNHAKGQPFYLYTGRGERPIFI